MDERLHTEKLKGYKCFKQNMKVAKLGWTKTGTLISECVEYVKKDNSVRVVLY